MKPEILDIGTKTTNIDLDKAEMLLRAVDEAINEVSDVANALEGAAEKLLSVQKVLALHLEKKRRKR